MNIVAIVGSNNPNSITKKSLDQIFLNLHKLGTYHTEIIWLKDHSLAHCHGCNSCFYTNECVMDNKDTLGWIKRKLQQTDCIIFASPVYLNSCSGLMKTFIDRLAYQTHLMSYAGKLSINILTTAQSGILILNEYFSELQCHFGMKNLGTYAYKAINANFEAFIIDAATGIHKSIESNFSWSTSKLENQFKVYYNLYTETQYGSKKEKDYWNQAEVKNCKSFQEYAILMRTRRSEVEKYATAQSQS